MKTGTTYFISGSNRAGELLGLSDCNLNPGVSVNETGIAGWSALMSLPETTKVFVDSGAFGEVRFDGSQLVDRKPITDRGWRKRLSKMEAVAHRFGPNAYLVAPDKVGDQATTLRRLRRYRKQVWELHARGAEVIVVLQRGERSQAQFAGACRDVLGFEPRWGFPCKKAATSPAELASAVAELGQVKVHLLGVGPCSRKWAEYRAACGDSDVSCDSVRVTALVGRTGKVRPLTAMQDKLQSRFPCLSATNKVRVAIRSLFKARPAVWVGVMV